jgi:DNA-binding PadR family transcriptional regulator
MSLRFALLALLQEEEATGYELAKRFDAGVSHYWHALPQQIYQELSRMEEEGLVSGEVVVQEKRPNKRIFSVTAIGQEKLAEWQLERAPVPLLKSELLVKVFASDFGNEAAIDALIVSLEEYVAFAREKFAIYEQFRDGMFKGRDEETFLRTTRRAGPYLTLKRGLMFEEKNIEWSQWVISALKARRPNAEPDDAASRGRATQTV